jgi:hypothetical protein
MSSGVQKVTERVLVVQFKKVTEVKFPRGRATGEFHNCFASVNDNARE